jgi:hypothetical protein
MQNVVIPVKPDIGEATVLVGKSADSGHPCHLSERIGRRGTRINGLPAILVAS